MSSNRDSKRAPSPSKSARTAKDGDASSDDQSPVPGTATYSIRRDGSFMQEPKSPRRRRRFTATRRSEVAIVRKFGACEECRKKKIGCKHTLDRISQSTSPAASAASPNPDHDFDASHPDLSLRDRSRGFLLPDNERRKSLSSGRESMYSMYSMDSADPMLRDIPTPAGRLDRMVHELHDFDTTFGDFSNPIGLDLSFPAPDWSPSYQPDAASEPLLSEPSSTSDNTHLSSMSPPSSVASDNDSMLTARNTTHFYHCDVVGCDLNHGFSSDIDLRRHQESRHADLFAPSVTFTCSVNGCHHQRWPFVRKDKLIEHVRLQHPDVFQDSKGARGFESEEFDLLRFEKQHWVDQYLADEYWPGMNDVIAYPARNRLPGENVPFLKSTLRETTSSRGRIQKPPPRPRRPSNAALNAAASTMTPQRFPSPPSNMEISIARSPSRSAAVPNMTGQRFGPPARNLEREWSNNNASSQGMPDPFGMEYSSIQGNQMASGYGAVPDMYGNVNLQLTGQTYGLPPSAPVPFPQVYADSFGMTQTVQPQQSFATPTGFQTGYPGPGDIPSQQGLVGQNSFQSGYPAMATMNPTQQGFANLSGFQTGSPLRPRARTHPQRGPPIHVRPPTFHEDTHPNPYTAAPVPSPIAETPLLSPFDQPSLNNYRRQQNLGFGGPSQQPQYGGMQNNFVQDENWMNELNMEETRSISDNYDMLDDSSINYSSPGSEFPGNRRTSLASLNQIMHDGFSRPATPPSMERGGPRSLSSAASPHTMAEVPIAPADLGGGDLESGSKYSYEAALGQMSPNPQGLFDL